MPDKWWFATVIAGCGMLTLPQIAVAEGLLPYQDKARVANGRTIYAAQCASCHGEQLAGEANWRDPNDDGMMRAPPHDQTGHTWHHSDQQLFLITKFGTARLVGGGYQSNMAGFSDILSDQDIVDVLGYIKSTWPNQVIQRHNRTNDGSG